MAIDFEPFDPMKPVRRYRRDLPHWRQDGATYFLTFRLWDSLPHDAVRHLETLREVLKKAAGRSDLWLQADRRLFQSMKRFLVAGYGECLFRNPQSRKIMEESLRSFDGERYQLGEVAIMPNHVHALLRPVGGWELEDILQRLKSYSAREINRVLKRSGPVWQEEAYDRIVRDSTELARVERYIRSNRGEERDVRGGGGPPPPQL